MFWLSKIIIILLGILMTWMMISYITISFHILFIIFCHFWLSYRFRIKQFKIENEVRLTKKSTIYTFVAPGVIGKGRERGLRSLAKKDNMLTKSLFPQSSNSIKQYLQKFEPSEIFYIMTEIRLLLIF